MARQRLPGGWVTARTGLIAVVLTAAYYLLSAGSRLSDPAWAPSTAAVSSCSAS
ncbi:MAG: hypothetical protein ACLP7J_02595 [Streptosporangiaceae bacterium]